MIAKTQKIVSIILVALVMLLTGGAIFAQWMLIWRPVTVPGTVTFMIHGGMNATDVALRLEQEGLIRNVDFFLETAVKQGYDTRFKEGTFQISGIFSAREMAHLLTLRPALPNVKITIPEGLTITETASCLNGFARIDSVEFVRLAQDTTFMRKIGITQPSLEGYLFPDTYYISEITTAPIMIERMVRQFNSVFTDSLRARAGELGMSVQDILTLASIAQLETPVRAELPVVSQVFHSRLEKRWRLEANPTIQYILGEKRRVLLDDLDVASPFNTYTHIGLPPGPIASPGRDAIMAALYPSATEYLFFMADGNGGHIFSTTLEEHNKAADSYRQIRDQMSVQ